MIGTIFRDGIFDRQGALVTGAARGIGAGIATALARLGAQVVLHDIDAVGLRRTRDEILASGGSATTVEADLSSPGAAEDVFARALAEAGALHILVNNAGRSWAVATADIEPVRTQELIELNLKSVLTLSQHFVAHAFQRGGGGSIVQISSTAGVTGFQRRAVYCATKFGVVGLTRVLALDHARDGIRVNAVLPHVVETDMFRTIAEPEEVRTWREGIPMGRFATVEDVANLVVFLCSPAGSYLTGGTYPVDGGMMAGPFGGEP
jgi:NAD(P)-dependent dehydrogenase (short-subunit alcohol dehydrogenase family)